MIKIEPPRKETLPNDLERALEPYATAAGDWCNKCDHIKYKCTCKGGDK